MSTRIGRTDDLGCLPGHRVISALSILLLALALSACRTTPASTPRHAPPTPEPDVATAPSPPPHAKPAKPNPAPQSPTETPEPAEVDRPIPEPASGDRPVPEPPAEPPLNDYDGLDKQARIAFGRAYMEKPRKPRVNATKEGIVTNEDWSKWQAELREYETARRRFHRDMAAQGEAFLGDFPESKYAIEVAGATLSSLYHSGDHQQTLHWAGRLLSRYGDDIAERCFQFRGDSFAALEDYGAAAAAYADYHAHASTQKRMVSAVKWVNALLQAGRTDEAIRVGRKLQSSVPTAAARIEAILWSTALIGEPLPATPGARMLLSEEGVDWAALKGKVTLVFIWSSQFASCDPALEEVSNLLARLDGRPFQVVGVVLEEKATDAEVDAWLSKHEIRDFVQVIQRGRFSQSEILNRWGLADEKAGISTMVPETIILGKDGIVRYVHIPVGKHLEKLIRQML